MEPKTKKWKKEKLKKENGYAQNIGKQSKESVESAVKKKGNRRQDLPANKILTDTCLHFA